MLRLFRRGGGVRLSALLAAGALGLARPAAAAGLLPGGPPAAGHAAHGSAGAGRLAEIKVELAWMGDRTTFPYPLSARVQGNQLRVSGRVPNEAVRRHALQVARKVSSLMVQDALVLQPSLPPGTLPATGEELLPRVRWVLSEVLGARAAPIEVGSRMGGHIVLRGKVASWEEKHSLSVRLRELRGCASVVNLLEVTGAPAPRPTARVMPPVSQPTAPAPRPALAPRWRDAPPPAKVMPRASQPDRPAPPPLPAPRLPDVPPAKPVPEPPLMPPLMPPAVRLPASPVYGGPTYTQVCASEEVGVVIASADTVPAPAAPIATTAQLPVSPYHAAPAPLSAPVAPAPLSAPLITAVEETPPVKAKPAPKRPSAFAQENSPPLRCGTPTRDWPTPVQAVPAQPMPLRRTVAPIPPPAPAKPSMGARLVAWFKGKPKPKAPPETPTPPRKTHNGWLAGSRPKLLSARVQKKATNLGSESAIPDKPFVTTGTVIFNDGPAVSPALPPRGQPSGARGMVLTAGQAAVAPSAARLRQKVLSACSGQARDVHVETRPDQSLQVTIKVADAEREKNVLTRVLQLPEMVSPNVHVFVEVAP